jgi:glycosyltransferase involved in cell wall biosynthesis
MNTSSVPYISVIVPLYNEEPNLRQLTEGLRRSLGPMGHPFELIFVDDGSTDGSQETLRALKAETPELRVILFWRNFGQSAAMTAGFDYCRGEIVVTLDGDLQNDPQDIPRMITELEKGYDVINGWRKERKDPFFSRRIPSILANWIIGRTTGVRLHDYGCSLKAYRRAVAKQLLLYGELHRFIPVLASFYGARIAEMTVSHHPRQRGRSKYGIGRTYRVMLDLLLMLFFQKFATRPLQLFGLGGGLLFGIGLLIELYLTWLKLWEGQPIGARPLLLLGVLLIISGVVLSGIGLLAELVMRTYYESSGRRIYAVRDILE